MASGAGRTVFWGRPRGTVAENTVFSGGIHCENSKIAPMGETVEIIRFPEASNWSVGSERWGSLGPFFNS